MRISKGDKDDIQMEMDRGFFILKGKVEDHEDKFDEIKSEFVNLKQQIKNNLSQIEDLEKKMMNYKSLENLGQKTTEINFL